MSSNALRAEHYSQHSPDTIRAALSYIPSDDRETWIEMGMAVKSEFGDSGFDVWDQWSQSADSYNARDAKAAWRSFKEGGPITIGSLLYEAKQHGFNLNGKGKQITAAEWEQIRKEREIRQQLEAEKRIKEEAAVAQLAEEIYKAAAPATRDHAYLKRKGIPATPGLKVGRWYQVGTDGKRFREKDNCLLVPMRDAEGKLWNLQAIFPEPDAELGRDKDYLLGGRKQATYFSIGKPDGAVALGEGLATMASIRASTGLAVCVAFDKGNLGPVAKALRTKLPYVRLIIAADNDIREGKPNYGIEKSTEAAAEVGGYIAIPELDGQKCDFNDLHQAKGPEAVKAAIEGAQPVAPKEERKGDMQALATDVAERQPYPLDAWAQPSADQSQDWPRALSDEAFYGLPGELVKQIEPQTEADEAAVLLQVLVSFGALVGRGPHVRVEGDQHHANLFALIVGDTSKARKGTSWGRVRETYSRILPPIGEPAGIGWPKVVDGLSSGEGLKWAVRDRITKRESDGATLSDVEVDPGVSDKRILVVESEFAQVLRQCARAGNTLSSTIRCAWDSGRLQTLTKNDPITATDAHISIVGHITTEELKRELTQTDSANGFANRFLFMCAKRSKSLPFGGEPMPEDLISHFASRLARAAAKARQVTVVEMAADAKAIWSAVYPKLSAGHVGLFGAVTARAEAQCLRLALVYALLDEDTMIRGPHIMAALAIWNRAEESARYIFGHSVGDPKADEIHRALQRAGDAGLTRTQISQLFNRHETTERIGVALDLLKSRGMAGCVMKQTKGAPSEVWYAC